MLITWERYAALDCLKRYIEKKGHHVEHIRIRSDKEIMNSFYANCPSLDINIYRYFLRFIKHPVNNIKLYPLFVASCKKQKWINKRKKVFQNYLKQMKAVNIGDKPFDLYVLGSDEIWNISSSLCRESVFWGNGYGPSIVYAACTSGVRTKIRLDYIPRLLIVLKILNKLLLEMIIL